MENRRNLRLPMQATRANLPEARSSEAIGNEGQNMEELSLLPYRGEMRALGGISWKRRAFPGF
jgi:hypothetical protein